jgi:cardiolipin synthase (CMP-forming)
MTKSWRTLPNAITLTRLALVPLFIGLYTSGREHLAALWFVVAILTDGLDGLLARILQQQSKLGAFLDALADKVLIFAALVLLVVHDRVPLWLVGLIALRDGLMVVGTIVVRRKHLELPSRPSRIGKYATFALALYVILALLDGQASGLSSFRGYVPVIGFIAALCVVVSTLQYFARFGHLFFDPPRRLSSPPEQSPRRS